MIQDIYPRKINNSYMVDAKATSDSLVIVYREGKFLVALDGNNGNISFPKLSEFSQSLELTYLFSIDNESFYGYLEGELTSLPAGYDFHDMRKIRGTALSPQHYVFAAFTAYQLIEWYRTTKFCGACGHENENSKTERARICPHCGNTIYPRINPAVIVGVTNGDKLLLTKYKTGFAHNALVAGFTEIGETIEETVEREVMEETGLKVKNIRYYKSQPWGIASDLLLGFYCEVDGDDNITMDESELKYAQWVSREDIILQPMNYSLTNEMMTKFKEGLI